MSDIVSLQGRQAIVAALGTRGFVHVEADIMRGLLAPALRAWPSFAASWDRLPPDPFMGDGGRYRRRRHACFAIGGAGERGPIRRLAHRPHYQTLEHNRLNGGVSRIFEPVEEAVAGHEVLAGILSLSRDVFDEPGGMDPWFVEMHQFRIEATPGEAGRPTPEGVHRDGVDWVLVLLVRRENVEEGETSISDAAGDPLGQFTLAEPGEAVFLDDRRCFHGVTPIRPRDPGREAFRDVLVVTFKAADAPS